MNRVFLGAITGVALAMGMGASHAQDFQPAIIYDLGGKFDKSFNEAAYNGQGGSGRRISGIRGHQ